MIVSKYTENFVGLCVDTFFMEEKYKDFFSKYKSIRTLSDDGNCTSFEPEDYCQFKTIKIEADQAKIKILFRIEHCEDYHMPAAQVITEIIDKTIGSNYMKRRPSDEQLRDIIQNHVHE